jgi:Protein of unknown function (DUF3108)
MKRASSIISSICLLLLIGYVYAQPEPDQIDSLNIDQDVDQLETEKSDSSYFPEEINFIPFGVGERLRYHLDFSFVKAGVSEMSIVGTDTILGRQAYHFRSRVKSTRGIDLVYKVRDVVESWFDTEYLYSHRFDRNVREGSYRSKKFYDYDHESQWVCVSNENGPKGLSPFERYSHNIISALFWVRTQHLEVGNDLHIPLHDQDKQYPMKLIVHGKETIKVPAGKFDCWKVEPVIESEGLFKLAGRLIVWITDDKNRLPVKMDSKIPFGTIQAKLVEYRLGQSIDSTTTIKMDESDRKWDW